ncbi:hypothetical protein EJ03DRAFT_371921 [Teratosphaeria nubilosa]|uniref:Uncharacterized protein n=1 Tax=Teratosphaeria nubilosa TaxID=161662 RepID=A0A6G1LJI5_9PEZI|nr:hypothetical protein EJ03DRAFT_371921 [Teratosphaeria nubilosa]
MSTTLSQNKRVPDMAGLREQIKANIASMHLPSLSTPQIIISKPRDDAKFTAWILDDGVRPNMRGLHCATPEEALESLLQVTAELVAEELFHEFVEYERRGGDEGGRGNGMRLSKNDASGVQNSGHGYAFQEHG